MLANITFSYSRFALNGCVLMGTATASNSEDDWNNIPLSQAPLRRIHPTHLGVVAHSPR